MGIKTQLTHDISTTLTAMYACMHAKAIELSMQNPKEVITTASSGENAYDGIRYYGMYNVIFKSP